MGVAWWDVSRLDDSRPKTFGQTGQLLPGRGQFVCDVGQDRTGQDGQGSAPPCSMFTQPSQLIVAVPRCCCCCCLVRSVPASPAGSNSSSPVRITSQGFGARMKQAWGTADRQSWSLGTSPPVNCLSFCLAAVQCRVSTVAMSCVGLGMAAQLHICLSLRVLAFYCLATEEAGTASRTTKSSEDCKNRRLEQSESSRHSHSQGLCGQE